MNENHPKSTPEKQNIYASRLPDELYQQVKANPFATLQDEIEMVRVMLIRTLEHASEAETLDEHIYLLRYVNFTALVIARLMRASQTNPQSAPPSELQSAVDSLLDEFTARELRL